jgi:asparagine synthase (glutamine-hydrolysing)
MCGIGGCVLERGSQPEQGQLIAMRDAMAHRGPDDSGIQVIDNVGLVHTRLSIVDLSERGHQPMRHPGGGWWLAYNGEIYNHGALRRDLNGTPFLGTSDTETLLWALERWGLPAVSRLTGQFAFAALDLNERELLLCRDRFGVKPLYLAQFDGGVWFASEPAALLAAGAPAEPVSTAWSGIAAGSYLGGEATLLKGITRVLPGTWMTVSIDDGTVTSGRWHDPARDVDPVAAARLRGRSRSRLTTELETTLRSAVHGALLSDATVGTLCSGGLDSSLITALALEAKPDLVAFGASYTEEGEMAEGPAARRVAQALGIELDLLEVSREDFRRAFVSGTVHYGSPIANPSVIAVSLLADRARQLGVKVLLTGEGADELFGGYDLIHDGTLEAFLPWPQRMIRRAEPKLLGDPKRFLDPERVLRKLWRMARRDRGTSFPWTPLLNPDTGAEDSATSIAAYAHHRGQRQLLEAELLAHLDYTLCWLLNRMDKNAMQMSVETRVPFLEPEVVKLVLNLPLEARVGPWSKGILRDVARRVLPWSIAHRPKVYGMGFDTSEWIEEAADHAFLTNGILREKLQVPEDEFKQAATSLDGSMRLRMWSAEIWSRSVFAGHSIEQIERDMWR